MNSILIFLIIGNFICAAVSSYYLASMYKLITTKDPVILYSSRYSCLYFTSQALVSVIEAVKAFTIYSAANSASFKHSTLAAQAMLVNYVNCFDKWTISACLCCTSCIIAYAIRQNFGPKSKIGNWYCLFEALFSLIFIFVATLAIASTSSIRVIANPIHEITDTNIIRAMFYLSAIVLIWLNSKQTKGLNEFTIKSIQAPEDILGKRTCNLHISRTKFRSSLSLALVLCIAFIMHSTFPIDPLLREDYLALLPIIAKPVALLVLLVSSNKIILQTLSQVGIYE